MLSRALQDRYHPPPLQESPHLKHSTKNRRPIQNPIFDAHRNLPPLSVRNAITLGFYGELLEFYSLRGFLTSRPLRVH
ncbi:hypothetical protein HZ326_28903 [Fusarium oxysporum f. sp. albedinis]|nr:hypothetical protein HZ326_28903 [Fusarium oxysporum f. sp. albedinis]